MFPKETHANIPSETLCLEQDGAARHFRINIGEYLDEISIGRCWKY